jgi:hypothetical protein
MRRKRMWRRSRMRKKIKEENEKKICQIMEMIR